MKKRNLIALLAGTAAVGIYRAAKGKGAFNKLRFAEQHEAVGRYVDAHHHGAFYSPIEPVDEGWSCIITDNGERFLLYITCSQEGVFIFDENKI